MIDKALTIAQRNDVIFTSYGDMLRIPGTEIDLLTAKSNGSEVRIVYSPLESVEMAKNNPDKKVVFFAVGFETTAPANAAAILLAKKLKLKNFSVLCSQVLVPPAVELILSSKKMKLDALLAPGHVCTITGYIPYEEIAKKYNIPIVVTGFEPVDILQGVNTAVSLLEKNSNEVLNEYKRVVGREGNKAAMKVIDEVFEIADRNWRGIGRIPKSGYKIKEELSEFDAEKIFNVEEITAQENPECIAGEILQGLKIPNQCKLFGNKCTPAFPVGAPMVSSEGACAAYFQYKKYKLEEEVS